MTCRAGCELTHVCASALLLGRQDHLWPQGLKREERIIFAVKAFSSQQRAGKQMVLPKQMGFVGLSSGKSCQEAAGWERPCKHWFNPSVLPLPAGMLYQHPYLLHCRMLQGPREQSGDWSPLRPSLAPPPWLPQVCLCSGSASWEFPILCQDSLSLCCRHRAFVHPRANRRLHPGLLKDAQRDDERQQQELQ